MPSEIAIPSTQRAIVNVAHDKPVEIHDSWPVVSPSELAPGECLVKMLVSGVCHSDLHIRDGEWSSIPPPLVGVHEGIGTIVAIGKGTPEHNKVRIGSRVGVKWTTGACDQCEMCRTGLEPLCASVKASGFNMHGTFSEYMVAYVNHVVPIPETLDSSVAAPILCAGVTVYRGLKVSGAKAGHWAVIPGAGGGLGHLAVQYAVAMGLRVMAIDTGDDKRKLCAALGAEEWIDFKEDGNIVEAVKARCKDEFGPHVAVITSPIGATYDDAIAYLRPSGILVALALPTGYTFKTGMMSIVARNITILGSSNGSLREATEAVDFAARNKVKTHVHVHELSEIENIYADMRAGKLVGRAVVRIQA